MRRRPAIAGVVLAAALAVGLGACGVPTGGAPRAIARSQVPFNLLSQTPPTTTPTTAPSSGILVDVFLLNSAGNASAVQREVPAPADLRTALEALMKGPTISEQTAGYSTAIPDGTRVLAVADTSGVVTVDLSAPFGQLSGTAQVQAVEQVVFTVVAQTTPATGVTFEVSGLPVDVPIAQGQEAPGPVYAWAYLPGSIATTTTTTTTTPTPTTPGAGAGGP